MGFRKDDFDDYGSEKLGEEKKPKNFFKGPNIPAKVLSDGSIFYKKALAPRDKRMIISMCLVPIWLIAIIYIIITYGNAGQEAIVPMAIMLGFFALFGLISFIYDQRCRSFCINNDHIDIVTFTGKKVSYPISSYDRMSYTRNYRKHHRYNGTSYFVMINEGMSVKKYRFCTDIAEAASRFDYEVRKRQLELSGGSLPPDSGVSPRVFSWPDDMKKLSRNSNVLLYFPVMVVFFMAFAIVMNNSTHRDPVMIPMFVSTVTCVIISVVVLSAGRQAGSLAIPQMMSFDDSGVKVDDIYLRSSEIKSIYITPVGSNNPIANNMCTLYLVTEDGQYMYKTMSLLASALVRSIPMPNWEYSDFYEYIREWCLINNVEFIDLKI